MNKVQDLIDQTCSPLVGDVLLQIEGKNQLSSGAQKAYRLMREVEHFPKGETEAEQFVYQHLLQTTRSLVQLTTEDNSNQACELANSNMKTYNNFVQLVKNNRVNLNNRIKTLKKLLEKCAVFLQYDRYARSSILDELEDVLSTDSSFSTTIRSRLGRLDEDEEEEARIAAMEALMSATIENGQLVIKVKTKAEIAGSLGTQTSTDAAKNYRAEVESCAEIKVDLSKIAANIEALKQALPSASEPAIVEKRIEAETKASLALALLYTASLQKVTLAQLVLQVTIKIEIVTTIIVTLKKKVEEQTATVEDLVELYEKEKELAALTEIRLQYEIDIKVQIEILIQAQIELIEALKEKQQLPPTNIVTEETPIEKQIENEEKKLEDLKVILINQQTTIEVIKITINTLIEEIKETKETLETQGVTPGESEKKDEAKEIIETIVSIPPATTPITTVETVETIKQRIEIHIYIITVIETQIETYIKKVQEAQQVLQQNPNDPVAQEAVEKNNEVVQTLQEKKELEVKIAIIIKIIYEIQVKIEQIKKEIEELKEIVDIVNIPKDIPVTPQVEETLKEIYEEEGKLTTLIDMKYELEIKIYIIIKKIIEIEKVLIEKIQDTSSVNPNTQVQQDIATEQQNIQDYQEELSTQVNIIQQTQQNLNVELVIVIKITIIIDVPPIVIIQNEQRPILEAEIIKTIQEEQKQQTQTQVEIDILTQIENPVQIDYETYIEEIKRQEETNVDIIYEIIKENKEEVVETQVKTETTKPTDLQTEYEKTIVIISDIKVKIEIKIILIEEIKRKIEEETNPITKEVLEKQLEQTEKEVEELTEQYNNQKEIAIAIKVIIIIQTKIDTQIQIIKDIQTRLDEIEEQEKSQGDINIVTQPNPEKAEVIKELYEAQIILVTLIEIRLEIEVRITTAVKSDYENTIDKVIPTPSNPNPTPTVSIDEIIDKKITYEEHVKNLIYLETIIKIQIQIITEIKKKLDISEGTTTITDPPKNEEIVKQINTQVEEEVKTHDEIDNGNIDVTKEILEKVEPEGNVTPTPESIQIKYDSIITIIINIKIEIQEHIINIGKIQEQIDNETDQTKIEELKEELVKETIKVEELQDELEDQTKQAESLKVLFDIEEKIRIQIIIIIIIKEKLNIPVPPEEKPTDMTIPEEVVTKIPETPTKEDLLKAEEELATLIKVKIDCEIKIIIILKELYEEKVKEAAEIKKQIDNPTTPIDEKIVLQEQYEELVEEAAETKTEYENITKHITVIQTQFEIIICIIIKIQKEIAIEKGEEVVTVYPPHEEEKVVKVVDEKKEEAVTEVTTVVTEDIKTAVDNGISKDVPPTTSTTVQDKIDTIIKVIVDLKIQFEVIVIKIIDLEKQLETATPEEKETITKQIEEETTKANEIQEDIDYNEQLAEDHTKLKDICIEIEILIQIITRIKEILEKVEAGQPITKEDVVGLPITETSTAPEIKEILYTLELKLIILIKIQIEIQITITITLKKKVEEIKEEIVQIQPTPSPTPDPVVKEKQDEIIRIENEIKDQIKIIVIIQVDIDVKMIEIIELKKEITETPIEEEEIVTMINEEIETKLEEEKKTQEEKPKPNIDEAVKTEVEQKAPEHTTEELQKEYEQQITIIINIRIIIEEKTILISELEKKLEEAEPEDKPAIQEEITKTQQEVEQLQEEYEKEKEIAVIIKIIIDIQTKIDEQIKVIEKIKEENTPVGQEEPVLTTLPPEVQEQILDEEKKLVILINIKIHYETELVIVIQERLEQEKEKVPPTTPGQEPTPVPQEVQEKITELELKEQIQIIEVVIIKVECDIHIQIIKDLQEIIKEVPTTPIEDEIEEKTEEEIVQISIPDYQDIIDDDIKEKIEEDAPETTDVNIRYEEQIKILVEIKIIIENKIVVITQLEEKLEEAKPEDKPAIQEEITKTQQEIEDLKEQYELEKEIATIIKILIDIDIKIKTQTEIITQLEEQVKELEEIVSTSPQVPPETTTQIKEIKEQIIEEEKKLIVLIEVKYDYEIQIIVIIKEIIEKAEEVVTSPTPTPTPTPETPVKTVEELKEELHTQIKVIIIISIQIDNEIKKTIEIIKELEPESPVTVEVIEKEVEEMKEEIVETVNIDYTEEVDNDVIEEVTKEIEATTPETRYEEHIKTCAEIIILIETKIIVIAELEKELEEAKPEDKPAIQEEITKTQQEVEDLKEDLETEKEISAIIKIIIDLDIKIKEQIEIINEKKEEVKELEEIVATSPEVPPEIPIKIIEIKEEIIKLEQDVTVLIKIKYDLEIKIIIIIKEKIEEIETRPPVVPVPNQSEPEPIVTVENLQEEINEIIKIITVIHIDIDVHIGTIVDIKKELDQPTTPQEVEEIVTVAVEEEKENIPIDNTEDVNNDIKTEIEEKIEETDVKQTYDNQIQICIDIYIIIETKIISIAKLEEKLEQAKPEDKPAIEEEITKTQQEVEELKEILEEEKELADNYNAIVEIDNKIKIIIEIIIKLKEQLQELEEEVTISPTPEIITPQIEEIKEQIKEQETQVTILEKIKYEIYIEIYIIIKEKIEKAQEVPEEPVQIPTPEIPTKTLEELQEEITNIINIISVIKIDITIIIEDIVKITNEIKTPDQPEVSVEETTEKIDEQVKEEKEEVVSQSHDTTETTIQDKIENEVPTVDINERYDFYIETCVEIKIVIETKLIELAELEEKIKDATPEEVPVIQKEIDEIKEEISDLQKEYNAEKEIAIIIKIIIEIVTKITELEKQIKEIEETVGVESPVPETPEQPVKTYENYPPEVKEQIKDILIQISILIQIRIDYEIELAQKIEDAKDVLITEFPSPVKEPSTEPGDVKEGVKEDINDSVKREDVTQRIEDLIEQYQNQIKIIVIVTIDFEIIIKQIVELENQINPTQPTDPKTVEEEILTQVSVEKEKVNEDVDDDVDGDVQTAVETKVNETPEDDTQTKYEQQIDIIADLEMKIQITIILIQNLEEKLEDATTPEEKAIIQEQIDEAKDELEDLNEQLETETKIATDLYIIIIIKIEIEKQKEVIKQIEEKLPPVTEEPVQTTPEIIEIKEELKEAQTELATLIQIQYEIELKIIIAIKEQYEKLVEEIKNTEDPVVKAPLIEQASEIKEKYEDELKIICIIKIIIEIQIDDIIKISKEITPTEVPTPEQITEVIETKADEQKETYKQESEEKVQESVEQKIEENTVKQGAQDVQTTYQEQLTIIVNIKIEIETKIVQISQLEQEAKQDPVVQTQIDNLKEEVKDLQERYEIEKQIILIIKIIIDTQVKIEEQKEIISEIKETYNIPEEPVTTPIQNYPPELTETEIKLIALTELEIKCYIDLIIILQKKVEYLETVVDEIEDEIATIETKPHVDQEKLEELKDNLQFNLDLIVKIKTQIQIYIQITIILKKKEEPIKEEVIINNPQTPPTTIDNEIEVIKTQEEKTPEDEEIVTMVQEDINKEIINQSKDQTTIEVQENYDYIVKIIIDLKIELETILVKISLYEEQKENTQDPQEQEELQTKIEEATKEAIKIQEEIDIKTDLAILIKIIVIIQGKIEIEEKKIEDLKEIIETSEDPVTIVQTQEQLVEEQINLIGLINIKIDIETQITVVIREIIEKNQEEITTIQNNPTPTPEEETRIEELKNEIIKLNVDLIVIIRIIVISKIEIIEIKEEVYDTQVIINPNPPVPTQEDEDPVTVYIEDKIDIVINEQTEDKEEIREITEKEIEEKVTETITTTSPETKTTTTTLEEDYKSHIDIIVIIKIEIDNHIKIIKELEDKLETVIPGTPEEEEIKQQIEEETKTVTTLQETYDAEVKIVICINIIINITKKIEEITTKLEELTEEVPVTVENPTPEQVEVLKEIYELKTQIIILLELRIDIEVKLLDAIEKAEESTEEAIKVVSPVDPTTGEQPEITKTLTESTTELPDKFDTIIQIIIIIRIKIDTITKEIEIIKEKVDETVLIPIEEKAEEEIKELNLDDETPVKEGVNQDINVAIDIKIDSQITIIIKKEVEEEIITEIEEKKETGIVTVPTPEEVEKPAAVDIKERYDAEVDILQKITIIINIIIEKIEIIKEQIINAPDEETKTQLEKELEEKEKELEVVKTEETAQKEIVDTIKEIYEIIVKIEQQESTLEEVNEDIKELFPESNPDTEITPDNIPTPTTPEQTIIIKKKHEVELQILIFIKLRLKLEIKIQEELQKIYDQHVETAVEIKKEIEKLDEVPPELEQKYQDEITKAIDTKIKIDWQIQIIIIIKVIIEEKTIFVDKLKETLDTATTPTPHPETPVEQPAEEPSQEEPVQTPIEEEPVQMPPVEETPVEETPVQESNEPEPTEQEFPPTLSNDAGVETDVTIQITINYEHHYNEYKETEKEYEEVVKTIDELNAAAQDPAAPPQVHYQLDTEKVIRDELEQKMEVEKEVMEFIKIRYDIQIQIELLVKVYIEQIFPAGTEEQTATLPPLTSCDAATLEEYKSTYHGYVKFIFLLNLKYNIEAKIADAIYELYVHQANLINALIYKINIVGQTEELMTQYQLKNEEAAALAEEYNIWVARAQYYRAQVDSETSNSNALKVELESCGVDTNAIAAAAEGELRASIGYILQIFVRYDIEITSTTNIIYQDEEGRRIDEPTDDMEVVSTDVTQTTSATAEASLGFQSQVIDQPSADCIDASVHTQTGTFSRLYSKMTSRPESCYIDGTETMFVQFKHAFAEIPKVGVTISGFTINGQRLYVNVIVDSIQQDGFYATITCGPAIDSLYITWIATLPEKSKIYVASISIAAAELEATGRTKKILNFPVQFSDASAIINFAGWDVEAPGSDLAVYVTDIKPDSVEITASGNSNVNFIKATVLFFERQGTTHETIFSQINPYSQTNDLAFDKANIGVDYRAPLLIWAGISNFQVTKAAESYTVNQNVAFVNGEITIDYRNGLVTSVISTVSSYVFYTNTERS